MALSQTQKSNFISEGRQLAANVVSMMNDLRAYRDRYDAGGYAAAVALEDFIGDNLGKTPVEFANSVTSFAALLTTYDAGNDTNLELFRS